MKKDDKNEIIKKIKNQLKKYPNIEYETDNNYITIKPNKYIEFSVSLKINAKNNYTVAFDFWHEEFTNEEEALNCFTFGLSKDCRLKLTKRGSKVFKWTVEYKDSGEWKEDSTVGLLNLVFWKPKTVEYLQNDVSTKE